ncbi:cold shock domain-containing protein [Brevibacillus agri]|uniref:cold-shock protein n=1 Tax=Brevibacillus TaxID=55080 RepID=UPI002E1EAA72
MALKRHLGRVDLFDSSKGYGFIKSFDGQRVFVHFSDIVGEGFRTLITGQVVEYEVVSSERGTKAVTVKVLERNNAIEHDTEDKQYWCRKGEQEEEAFIREIVPKIGKRLIIHPGKKSRKTIIDLYDLDRNIEADLKTQTTPFFSAGKYGLNPEFTVTFNHKDYEYYKNNYPNAIIYWWVNWLQLSWGNFKVDPLYGVWEVPFRTLQVMIENRQVPLHEYIHRKDDDVNAKSSYLFDLRHFQRLL